MTTRIGRRETGFRAKRGKDVRLRYAANNAKGFIVKVRTFVDENGVPVPEKPPLWLDRIESDASVCAVTLKGMRSIAVCIPNPNNKQLFSEFNVPIPYADFRLLATIKQFAAIPENERIRYTGESREFTFT